MDVKELRFRFEFDPLLAEDWHQGLGKSLLLLSRFPDLLVSEVWESREQQERFAEALMPILREQGIESQRNRSSLTSTGTCSARPAASRETDRQRLNLASVRAGSRTPDEPANYGMNIKLGLNPAEFGFPVTGGNGSGNTPRVLCAQT